MEIDNCVFGSRISVDTRKILLNKKSPRVTFLSLFFNISINFVISFSALEEIEIMVRTATCCTE